MLLTISDHILPLALLSLGKIWGRLELFHQENEQLRPDEELNYLDGLAIRALRGSQSGQESSLELRLVALASRCVALCPTFPSLDRSGPSSRMGAIWGSSASIQIPGSL